MNIFALVVSLLGGGLAGGCVSVFFNRMFHKRQLRTDFYPKVNDMYAAYLIRIQNQQGRYWQGIVGNNPAPADAQFVEHRTDFILNLVKFNELQEARCLRRTMLDNFAQGNHVTGQPFTVDLKPESDALGACLDELHKKLEL